MAVNRWRGDLSHCSVGMGLVIALFCSACQPVERQATTEQTATDKGAIEAAAPVKPLVRLRAESKPYVTVTAVLPESSSVAVHAPGRVDFRQRAMSGVGAVIAGRVTKVHVQTGDKVTVGQPLLNLLSPDAGAARAKLQRARVELTSAEELYKRQVQMLQRGVGLELDRFKAEARLKEARSELQRATEAASFLGEGDAESVIVRASIAGTVVHLKATVGAMAQPGETLIELGDPEALWVVADVFDRDLALVSIGDRASVELASLPAPILGRVAAIGAVPPATPLIASFACNKAVRIWVSVELNQMRSAAEQRNPAIEAARRAEFAATAAVASAKRERWPIPIVSLGSVWTNSPDSLTSFLGVSVEIPLFDRKQGMIAKAHAEQQTAMLSLASITAETRAEVERAARVLTEKQAALQSFEANALGQLDSLDRMAEDAYRLGQGGLVQLLDASRARTDLRLTHLDLQEAVTKAEVDTLAAGGLLMDYLEGRK